MNFKEELCKIDFDDEYYLEKIIKLHEAVLNEELKGKSQEERK